MCRNDGGFEYKRAIVDTLIAIVEENPDAKLAGQTISYILILEVLWAREWPVSSRY